MIGVRVDAAAGIFRFYLFLYDESSSRGVLRCNGTMTTAGEGTENSFHIFFPSSVCNVYNVDLN